MSQRAEHLVQTLLSLDPLSELPRTGWLLRGVRPCESIADHSFGVALTTMLLVDWLRADGTEIDGERALRMALVHDVPEAHTGDVPMPSKTPELSEALHQIEAGLADVLLPASQSALWREAEAAGSLEARVVKAADKIQMMVKVLVYERHHRGELSDFWQNPRNFDDRGLEPAREVFAAIRALAGKPPPQ
jgi:putative hydrolase of HD superfamily